MSIEQKNPNIYADSVSLINVNNGIVRIVLAQQSAEKLGKNSDGKENPADLMEPNGCLIMPMQGFLFMASLVKGLLDDQRMQGQIKRMNDAGLLPELQNRARAQANEAQANQTGGAVAAENAAKK